MSDLEMAELANLATSYLQQGQWHSAKKYYLQALKLDPQDAQVLFNLGVICAKQGHLKNALEFYLMLLQFHPYHDETHHNLGVLYFKIREKVAALHHFRLALSLKPDNHIARHFAALLTHQKTTTSPPAYLKALFDDYADYYEQHLQTLNNQLPQALLEMVQDYIGERDPRFCGDGTVIFQSALDVGCGTGLCGQVFKPYVKHLTGVDLSPKMLAAAALKITYNALYEMPLLDHLQTQRAAYELIIAGDVLVYDGDLSQFFTTAARALMPGGWIVFNTEISDNEDYVVTESGRFAHHRRYIEALAVSASLQCVAIREVTMRFADGKPLLGRLYLLRI